MRYQGGKARIAKYIAPHINQFLHPDSQYVEPFCGSLAITERIKRTNKPFILNDINPYLITLWKSMQDGWEPPSEFSKEEYSEVKARMDWTDPLTAYCGFFLSFGGKWFGGFAKPNFYANSVNGANEYRNYVIEAKTGFLKKASSVTSHQFYCETYTDLAIPESSVIYCDPPYRDTLSPSGIVFDSDIFWDWANRVAEHSVIIVSEFYCPDPSFEVIWEKEVLSRLNHANNFVTTEKLFMKGWLDNEARNEPNQVGGLRRVRGTVLPRFNSTTR